MVAPPLVLPAPLVDKVVIEPEKAASASVRDVFRVMVNTIQVILAILYMRKGHAKEWVPWILVATSFITLYFRALTSSHRSFHLDLIRQTILVSVVIAAIVWWSIVDSVSTEPLQLIFATIIAS